MIQKKMPTIAKPNVTPMKPFKVGLPSHNALLLTRHSVPSSCETAYYGQFLTALGWRRLSTGPAPSVWMYEQGSNPANVGFFAHLDTVAPTFKELNQVKFGEFLGAKNGFIGGDCRGGVAILLYLAHCTATQGRYFLTECEEVGMIGMKNELTARPSQFTSLDMAISVDRKGTSDCIVTQLGKACASRSFAEYFCEELLEQGLAYDLADGLFTDSALLGDLIPQVLNLSIGYYYNHSKREVISLDHIDKLGHALARMPWPALQEAGIEWEQEKIEENDPAGGYSFLTDDWLKDDDTGKW